MVNPSHSRSIAGFQPTDRLNKRITSADPRQRRSIVTTLPIDREERRSFAPASRTFARELAKLGRDGAGRSRPSADRARVQPIDREFSRPIASSADRSRVQPIDRAHSRKFRSSFILRVLFLFLVFFELFWVISEFLKC